MTAIDRYKHITGFHCGSTSIRSMLRFYGHELSEPMVLGIGQGLSVVNMADETFFPSHFIRVRATDLEMTAFQGFGVHATRHQTDDPEKAWQWVRQTLDRGEPAMLQADLSNLPYYKSGTPFAGHKIVVFGYDETAGVVLISDNEFEEPQTIAIEQLAKARVSPQMYFDLRNNWFEISVPERLRPLEEAIPEALRGQALKLLHGPANTGVRSLHHLSETITDWAQAKDWSWCARFTYQVIERRGSGGGAFRLKYSEFLREAGDYCPAVKPCGLAEIVGSSAAAWTELAYLLKEISDRDSPVGFEKAGPLLRQIADMETEFSEKVLESC